MDNMGESRPLGHSLTHGSILNTVSSFINIIIIFNSSLPMIQEQPEKKTNLQGDRFGKQNKINKQLVHITRHYFSLCNMEIMLEFLRTLYTCHHIYTCDHRN